MRPMAIYPAASNHVFVTGDLAGKLDLYDFGAEGFQVILKDGTTVKVYPDCKVEVFNNGDRVAVYERGP